MKITAIHATPVRVPRRGTFVSSLGADSYTLNAVVEVETDTGITGLGEASSIWGERGIGEARAIEEGLAPAVIGADPLAINALVAKMDAAVAESWPAKAGIEIALHDIAGKALGVPVHALLGGAVRERILLSHSLSMGSAAEIAEEAARLVGLGYRTLKVKVGRDADADEAAVRAVRERVGAGVTLRVDANMGWRSAAEALASIARLAPYELELVEQPLAREDLDGMRELRERSSVLVMADESVWTPRDALECVRRGAADVLNVYVSEAGGLRAAAAIFAIAEAAGIPCVVGSMPELGIGTAAQAHLAAAMRNLGFASDVNGCEYQADDVIRERLDIAGGHVRPPRGPGLGVTLDRDKVERYRVRDGEGA